MSQHIAELERAVGLRLVDRRPVRATEAGLPALAAADAVEDALAAAETGLRALRGGEAGSLRIAAFASAVTDMLAPALAEFARSRPDVEVTLTSAEPDEAHQALIHDRFDLAFTFDYDIDPRTPPAVVEREPMTDDPVLAALPAGHPLATRRAIRLDLLATEPWIAAPLAGLPLTTLREAARTGFTPHVRYEGEDFAAVLALVSAGLGIALLPRLATRKTRPTSRSDRSSTPTEPARVHRPAPCQLHERGPFLLPAAALGDRRRAAGHELSSMHRPPDRLPRPRFARGPPVRMGLAGATACKSRSGDGGN